MPYVFGLPTVEVISIGSDLSPFFAACVGSALSLVPLPSVGGFVASVCTTCAFASWLTVGSCFDGMGLVAAVCGAVFCGAVFCGADGGL